MLASSNKLKLSFFLLRSISIFVLKFLISILNIFATKSNLNEQLFEVFFKNSFNCRQNTNI